MRNYILTTPKDAHGQPLHLFRVHTENNVSKAIDQLSGICSGILADGVVNDAEANFFAGWMRKYTAYEPIWPFTDILTRIKRIFADGRCSDEERQELREVMQALCGYTNDYDPSETYSTKLPLDLPAPEPVVFPAHVFAITGRFAYGTRRKVMEAIAARGGSPSDTAPTRESHYLVVGLFASRDWYNTNYGRKIERAVELRDSGSGIVIISEAHWAKFVT